MHVIGSIAEDYSNFPSWPQSFCMVFFAEKQANITMSVNCETTCHCLANGHGRWTNNSWQPFYHGTYMVKDNSHNKTYTKV